MIELPSRNEIDSWAIKDAGFPKRVVNAMQVQGVDTVGQLRKISEDELIMWRSIGIGSLEDISTFFSFCDKLEEGKQKFKNLHSLLKNFLSESEIAVLTGRYGLERKGCKVSRNYYTLQHIATQNGLTRERIRQIQDEALICLSSHIASANMAPFYKQIIDLINGTGKIMSCSALCDANIDIFNGLSQCSTTLLLSDSDSSGFLFKYGVFTTLSEREIDDLYEGIKKELESMDKPVKLSVLAGDMDPGAVLVMLSTIPSALVTLDNRVIHSLKSMESFIFEFIPKNAERFHYKDLTDIANEHLSEATRKGPGFYLHNLAKIDVFEREGLGVYLVREPR